ncbi:class I SAM-dependent methyltransferase [Jiangella endophytica]|uniref:class I SAM-dependent methyltransferase n=1 Tax=Jiangella endophytica TaxID=1623398 RepID=UPI000E3492C2|nr:class I SAM-dependent methyltransferase [Jiangella endophytica]
MRAETAYHDALGEHFAARATGGTYNAYTDRPAMLELAGDVRGLDVLDLGCGAGHYAAELVKLGAVRVVGVDGSETLLRAAQQRLGGRAALHHHNLEEPLAFLADQSFDLAVMALVYHHIDARAQLLDELRRVLRPDGTLLVSTTHPTSDWTYFGGSYFADDRVEFPVGDGLTINYWRMTLQKFLGEFLGAGFVLEELVEPRATEEARLVDPRRYDRTHTAPTFLALRLRRP